MSGDPPKMSLKDRIAQFENSADRDPAPGPPAKPKLKPGGLTWKPRAPPQTPPASNPNDKTDESPSASSGMSASDAKASIGQAGMSLKDRMAALRGQGFQVGGDREATMPSLKPSEKPMWKPPPMVMRSPSTENLDDAEIVTVENVNSDDVIIQQANVTEPQKSLLSVEEEERERRAAIAARMARLGGARVGIGAPMFGQKSSTPKSIDVLPETNVTSQEDAPGFESVLDTPVQDASSAVSTSTQQSTSTQHTAPMPTVPRRAAPPRRKQPKTPLVSTPYPEATEGVIQSGSEAEAHGSLSEAITDSSDQSKSLNDSLEAISQDTAEASEDEQAIGDVISSVDSKTNDVEQSSEPKILSEKSDLPPKEGTLHLDDSPQKMTNNLDGHDQIESIVAQGSAEQTKDLRAKEQPISTSRNVAGDRDPTDTLHLANDYYEAVEIDDKSRDMSTESALPANASQSTAHTDSNSVVEAEPDTLPEEETEEETEAEKAARKLRVAKRMAKMGGVNPLVADGSWASLTEHPNNQLEASGVQSSLSIGISELTVTSPSDHDMIPPENSPANEVVQPVIDTDESERSGNVIIDKDKQVNQGFPTKRESMEVEEALSQPDVGSSDLSRQGEMDTAEPPPPPPRIKRSLPPVPSQMLDDASSFDPPESSVNAPKLAVDQSNEATLPTLPAQLSRPALIETFSGKSKSESQYQLSAESVFALIPAPFQSQQSIDGASSRESDVRSNIDGVAQIFSTEPLQPIPPPPPSRICHDRLPGNFANAPTSRERTDDEVESASLIIRSGAPSPENRIENGDIGDHIDPDFHMYTDSPQIDVQGKTQAEAAENHRQNIAERMARLGGIQLGGPMPSMNVKGRSAVPNSDLAQSEDITKTTQVADAEDEEVRRARIAAKLQSMGGMRIGILPGALKTTPPLLAGDEQTVAPPIVGDKQSLMAIQTSGAKDISYSMPVSNTSDGVEATPLPSARRAATKQSVASDLPGPAQDDSQGASWSTRPPIPAIPRHVALHNTSASNKEYVVKTTTTTPYLASEYREDSLAKEDILQSPDQTSVLLDPSLTPPRGTHRSSLHLTESPKTQSSWEIPTMVPDPLLRFDSMVLDLDHMSMSRLSTEEGSHQTPPMSPTVPTRPAPKRRSSQVPAPDTPKAPLMVDLTPEELDDLSQRIGSQIFEAAMQVYEAHKKSVVGDGSSTAFSKAAMGLVPNAAPPLGLNFGCLIYSQTGQTVHKRMSDVRPGDIVVIQKAILKGHKGLSSYHQEVGESEPAVAIVSSFEASNKSKMKVLQFNQSIKQKGVEQISYRLEDLKSGEFKARSSHLSDAAYNADPPIADISRLGY